MGAIHGRLLTAWSTAGIVGPVVVNYIREFNKAAGVPADQLYDRTLYILAGFLAVGLVCNLLVGPVNPKWLMPEDQSAQLQAQAGRPSGPVGGYGITSGGLDGRALLAWLAVGIPIAWGVWKTLESASKLFR